MSRVRIPTGRLFRAGVITSVVAVIANLVIWAAATAIIDVPSRFTPLNPGTVLFLTVVGVAAAAGLLRFLASRSSDPVYAFRRIVPIALLVTFIPDVLIWTASAYGGAAKAETVLPLMVMHIAAAAACWALLPVLAISHQTRINTRSPKEVVQ